jgi:copper(I)-binding protein
VKHLKPAIFSLLLVLVSTAAAEPLEVGSPWIREAPPGARVLAGYMRFFNRGATPVTLVNVTSPDFESAEIHRTVIEDGVARMLPVARLEIPANGRIDLEPGGRHLMLYNPSRPLRAGDTTTLTIHLADGSDVRLSVPVVPRDGVQNHPHH